MNRAWEYPARPYFTYPNHHLCGAERDPQLKRPTGGKILEVRRVSQTEVSAQQLLKDKQSCALRQTVVVNKPKREWHNKSVFQGGVR